MSVGLDRCTDGELAALVVAGQHTAFNILMARHRQAIYRLLRNQCGDAEAALDLTQQIFIAAFEALSRYDGDRPFFPWIARIAINKARDWARRRNVRRFLTFARPLEDAEAVADAALPPDIRLADRGELARTMVAMTRLPENLRVVLVLRTIEELSQAETASILSITEKAVETRLYRARQRLHDILRD